MKLKIKDLHEVAMVLNLVLCITLACYMFCGVINIYIVSAALALAFLQGYLFYKGIKSQYNDIENSVTDMHDNSCISSDTSDKNSKK